MSTFEKLKQQDNRRKALIVTRAEQIS